MKNFVWVGEGGSNTTVIDSMNLHHRGYKDLFGKYKENNIDGVVFFGNNPMWRDALKEAKRQSLEFHLWKPIMICNDKKIISRNPEWFAVNRQGISVIDKSPYVDYYKWLCPNNSEVKQYIIDEIDKFLDEDQLDGFHMDYIRYCDQYIPDGLIGNYSLKKGKYYPEYDYCYCDKCRELFKKKYGVDPSIELTEEQGLNWKNFRLNSISNLVSYIKTYLYKKNIKISAAVFPGPESYAVKNVKQKWSEWVLNAVFPMNYHSLYNEDTGWISTMVKEEKRSIGNNTLLYSGLYLENLSSSDLVKSVKSSMDCGADGVCLYSDDLFDDNLMKAFKVVSGLYR